MSSSRSTRDKGKAKIVKEPTRRRPTEEEKDDDVEFIAYHEPPSQEEEGHGDDEIELASITIPMRRKAGVAATPGVELDSVVIHMEGVRLAEGQSGYEFALEEARRSCPNHEPYHDHNPPPLQ